MERGEELCKVRVGMGRAGIRSRRRTIRLGCGKEVKCGEERLDKGKGSGKELRPRPRLQKVRVEEKLQLWEIRMGVKQMC